MNRLVRGLALVALVMTVCGCSDKAAQPPKEYAPPPSAGSSGGLKGGEPVAPPSLPKK